MLEARLVGGQEDPDGAWKYGRLEVSTGRGFLGLSETALGQERLGRRGVEVTCRTLGFATGVQLLSGRGSGLPGLDGTDDSPGRIICIGSEDTLADCDVYYERPDDSYQDTGSDGDLGDNAVALLCFTPSGV
eukprot:jgi/Ulvmu1/6018/UM260_0002.1